MTTFGKAASLVIVGAALALAGPVRSWAEPATPAPAAPAAPAVPSAPAVPAQPDAVQPSDAFGEEVTLAPKTIVFMKGTATWDSAFETLVDAFKSVKGFTDREKLKLMGPYMTVYLSTDDTGFQFQAAAPIEAEPKNVPHGDIAIGKSPEGKALKFVHRGTYDSMDGTYDAITNYLDEKKLEARDLFIEQYVTDPLTTPADKLVIEVYVPVQQ